MKKLTFKAAYLVEGWATELKKGFAVVVKEKSWGSEYDRIMFSEDMESFSFETEGSGNKKGVYFDFEKALKAIESEKNNYKEYCKKQVEEYSEKLKSF